MARQPEIRCLVRSPSLPPVELGSAQHPCRAPRSRQAYWILVLCTVLSTWGTVLSASVIGVGDSRPPAILSSSPPSPGRELWQSPRSRVGAPTTQPPELPPANQPAAPSMIWLVVMPAIPLMGGTLIYITRVCHGRSPIEERTVKLREAAASSSACEQVRMVEDAAEAAPDPESE